MTTVAGTTICPGCKGAVLHVGGQVLDAAPSPCGIYGEDGERLALSDSWTRRPRTRHQPHRCPRTHGRFIHHSKIA